MWSAFWLHRDIVRAFDPCERQKPRWMASTRSKISNAAKIFANSRALARDRIHASTFFTVGLSCAPHPKIGITLINVTVPTKTVDHLFNTRIDHLPIDLEIGKKLQTGGSNPKTLQLKSSLLYFLPAYISTVLILVLEVAEPELEPLSFSVLICIIFLLVARIINVNSSLHFLTLIGFALFITFPAILNLIFQLASPTLFFLTCIFVNFFLFWTRNTSFQKLEGPTSDLRVIFFSFGIFVIAVGLALGALVMMFLFPIFIFLMASCMRSGRKMHNIKVLSYFLIIFFIFVVGFWSGFGRLVVAGWILTALIYFCYYSGIKLNRYFAAIAIPFAVPLLKSRDVFNLHFAGWKTALFDSAFQPYGFASQFIDKQNIWNLSMDLAGLFDQILFTMFVYIPRSIWESKPVGFGFYFTIQHHDESLVDRGHSVAATFIGEHLYFLGFWGVISAFLMTYIAAKILVAIYNIRYTAGLPLIIASSNIFSLIWGGFASFSARFTISLLVLLVVIYVFRPIFRHSLRTPSNKP